jgi:hypothetical protein
MSGVSVLLGLVLLVVLFGLINYWLSDRAEKAQQAWFKQVLGEGVDKDEFLRSAPFEYLPLKAKGYGVVDKRSGQEVWKTKTPEDAEAWIVLNTLSEQGKLPKA